MKERASNAHLVVSPLERCEYDCQRRAIKKVLMCLALTSDRSKKTLSFLFSTSCHISGAEGVFTLPLIDEFLTIDPDR